MGLLVEILVGVFEIVTQFLFEIFGYMIWGILEVILTAAGGFFGGIIIGTIISMFWFWCLTSTWTAIWASCGTMVLSIVLGVLIEAGGGTK